MEYTAPSEPTAGVAARLPSGKVIGWAMQKAILLAIVLVPIWLGLLAASDRKPRRGLRRLVSAVVLLDVLFVLTLYYVYFRL